ncbi:hypothetical protein ABT154_04605 [Streptomyces sp. NPDC001728]|uniref:hypothetical protein n=1 Tax=Streptomyces sp. NPDC001728 TaxID=3154396 RepID=UPI0033297770
MSRWAIVVLVVVGSLVVLVPLGGIVAFIYVMGENHKNMRFPSDDVTVARCALDPAAGRPVAELSVTSRAAREGTFRVTVEFQGEREKAVGQGVGVVRDLAVGATGRATVVGARAYEGSSVRCLVYDAVFASTEPVATAMP